MMHRVIGIVIRRAYGPGRGGAEGLAFLWAPPPQPPHGPRRPKSVGSWRAHLPPIGVRALATAQGRWILNGASGSLAKHRSPASGLRLTFFGEMFFRRATWDIFFGTWGGGLLGLPRLPGRESGSTVYMQRICRGGSLSGHVAPLRGIQKRGSTIVGGPWGPQRTPQEGEKVPTRLPSRIARAPNRSIAYFQWILASWPSSPEFSQGFGTRQNHS